MYIYKKRNYKWRIKNQGFLGSQDFQDHVVRVADVLYVFMMCHVTASYSAHVVLGNLGRGEITDGGCWGRKEITGCSF